MHLYYHWLFPDNPILFLLTATASWKSELTWNMDRIPPSYCPPQHFKAAKRDSTNCTPNITFFFTYLSWGSVVRLRRSWQDNLIHDTYSKKHWQKQLSMSRHAQHSIVLFLSLCAQLIYSLNQTPFVSPNRDAATLCMQPGAPTRLGCGQQLFSEKYKYDIKSIENPSFKGEIK